jgi:hypothetical protein
LTGFSGSLLAAGELLPLGDADAPLPPSSFFEQATKNPVAINTADRLPKTPFLSTFFIPLPPQ